MTVQCIRCQHFSSQGNRAMAKVGYGRCAFEKRTSAFESAVFPRTCHQFEPSDAETAAARQAWFDREQERFKKEIGA